MNRNKRPKHSREKEQNREAKKVISIMRSLPFETGFQMVCAWVSNMPQPALIALQKHVEDILELSRAKQRLVDNVKPPGRTKRHAVEVFKSVVAAVTFKAWRGRGNKT